MRKLLLKIIIGLGLLGTVLGISWGIYSDINPRGGMELSVIISKIVKTPYFDLIVFMVVLGVMLLVFWPMISEYLKERKRNRNHRF